MKIKGIVFLILGVVQGVTYAQTSVDTLENVDRSNPSLISLNIDATYGMPRGEFRETLDRNAIGGSLEVLYHFPKTILEVGLGFSYLHFGTNRKSLIAGLNYKTTSGMFVPSLLVRADPKFRNISPYLEGSIGLNATNAQTKISGLIANLFDEDDEYLNEFYDTSLSYGFGAGLKILLKDWDYEDQKKTRLYLHIKGRYNYGGEVRYLTKDGVQIIENQNETEFVYNLSNSRTDLTTFQIGIYIGM